jgi:predicted DNA-binding protein (UPF0251 family)
MPEPADLSLTAYDHLRRVAVAMQRVLVDHARAKRADKRGGGGKRFELAEGDRVQVPGPDTVLAVDEALANLAAEVARLRVFAGLTVDEAAAAVGVSRATAFREWAYARAWLATACRGG